MRFKAVCMGLFLAVASGLKADTQFAAFAGVTNLNMNEVNKQFNDALDATNAMFSTNFPHANLLAGVMAGAELRTDRLLPFLVLGPRFEYIKAMTGSSQDTVTNVTLNLDTELYSGLLGAGFHIPLFIPGLGLGLSAYGGYGMGHYVLSSSNTTASSNLDCTGSGIIYEGEARLDYHVVGDLLFYGFGNYRIAKLDGFKDSKGTALGAPVDYSGIAAGAGLSLEF